MTSPEALVARPKTPLVAGENPVEERVNSLVENPATLPNVAIVQFVEAFALNPVKAPIEARLMANVFDEEREERLSSPLIRSRSRPASPIFHV